MSVLYFRNITFLTSLLSEQILLWRLSFRENARQTSRLIQFCARWILKDMEADVLTSFPEDRSSAWRLPCSCQEPAIIMADEPTGALDSNTGKQVFDTLKKLSSDKLIICVSHDREFAEQYADRIIELSDGKVIDDVTLENSASDEQNLSFNDNEITVPVGYELTEEDRVAINEYIRAIRDKKSRIIVAGGAKNKFAKTDQSKIDMKSDEKFDLLSLSCR